MRPIFLWPLFVLVACAHSRVHRFEELLDPKRGQASKGEISRLLGSPVKCEEVSSLERCEYRTASQRNDPVPGVHIPKPGMGPNVAPYEYFDVIHVYYDHSRTMQDWEPVVVHP